MLFLSHEIPAIIFENKSSLNCSREGGSNYMIYNLHKSFIIMKKFYFYLFFAYTCCMLVFTSGHGQLISTVAGTGSKYKTKDGELATEAQLGNEISVAFDSEGNYYISSADVHKVFKVDVSGSITTIAGTGSPGFSGDNGSATAAQMDSPLGIAVDDGGNIYIADGNNFRIRKVDPSGIISTVAGNGTNGFGGDGGPATSASFSFVFGVAVDGVGNLFIADRFNNRIRKVNSSGMITTFAGMGGEGNSGDGGPAVSAGLHWPSAVAVDGSSNVYISDSENHSIRKVDASGTITTIAGTGTQGYAGDGGPAIAAQLFSPWGLTLDSSGNLYFSDRYNNSIRKVDHAGIITSLAGQVKAGFGGDNGPAASAQLYKPSGVAVNSASELYISDSGNQRIRKVDASGTIATVAGSGEAGYNGDEIPATFSIIYNPVDVVVDGEGNFLIADQDNHRIRKVDIYGVITTVAGTGVAGFSGDGGAATAAQINSPTDLALDTDGNLYIADRYNHRIRKVDRSGIITTVAGAGPGFNGDGGPATSALLRSPSGVAVDGAGNIFIADVWNSRIRKVDGNGIISTVAGTGVDGFSGDGGDSYSAQLNGPMDVAVDGSGNIFIAEVNNQRIRKIDASGKISTVAGNGQPGFNGEEGVATSVKLYSPHGVEVDNAGNFYIADWSSNRIRKVDQNGMMTTVAGSGPVVFGTGSGAFGGDGGPATSALLHHPEGVAVDAAGNIYIADTRNYRIRMVGCSVSFDQSVINANTDLSAISFTFRGAEVGATYTYAINSDKGGSEVLGSVSISSANQQLSGVDVNGLQDGTLLLKVWKENEQENKGLLASASVIKDIIVPTVVSRDFTLELGDTGEAFLSTENIDNGSLDNLGSVFLSLDKISFSCTDLGENLVTLTASDGSENIATGTAKVLVVDNRSPVADEASLADATGECSVTISGIPTATDNCSGSIIGTTSDPLIYTEQGSFNITWTFEDANGNISTQTQAVIVEDVSAPTFTSPSDVVVREGFLPSLALQNVQDNCGAPQINFELSGATSASGTGDIDQVKFNFGETLVSYTVDDGRGNSSSSSFKVTYEGPTLGFPDDIEPIRLYPNPVNKGIVTLDLGKASGPLQIQIVDMAGKFVHETHSNTTISQPLNLDLSHLTGGIYFIRVIGSFGLKIVKLSVEN